MTDHDDKVVSLAERRARLSGELVPEGGFPDDDKVTERTVLVHVEQGTQKDGDPFTSATLIGKHHEWDLAVQETEFFGEGTVTIHLRSKLGKEGA